jgi:2-phospho-L-lactate guanylyltransferase
MRTLAILPVKRFDRAKQRLSPGLDPVLRRELAEAMFADVLDGVGRVEGLDGLIVVTGGGVARQIAHNKCAVVVQDDELGHNAAASLGIRTAIEMGADRVLLIPGDCPALDPDELDAFLARPTPPPATLIVPDRHGTGTNALLLAPPDAIEPAFGPDSCQRHLRLANAAGIRAQVVEVPSLAVDIDTPDDLDALQTPPASRTRELLSELSKC